MNFLNIFKKKTQSYTPNITFHDDDIKDILIKNIQAAKFRIYVVSAWFTSEDLFEELLKKKKQGVEIYIIIDKNNKNDDSGIPYSSAGTTYMLQVIHPNRNFPNIMHNKYCIIDDTTVIDGSFNWSDNASYNLEHIIVIKDKAVAAMYKDNFDKLRSSKYVL